MPVVPSRTVNGTYPAAISPLRLQCGPTGAMDEGTQRFYVAWPGWEASLTAAGVTKGSAVAGYTALFWDEFTSIEQDTEDTAIVDAVARGLIDHTNDKRRRRMSAYGQIVAVGPIEEVAGEPEYQTITTPSGTGERWNINDPIITVADTYFTTSAPNMAQVGTAQTPSSAPTAPSYLWGSYTDPLRANHPNGWVLDTRDPDEVIPGALWRVVDVFAYYQLTSPD